MADFRNYQARVATAGSRADAGIDEGLRAYMIRVYNLMALGLAITGIAALGTVMLATTNDPSQAVAQLGNGKMLTSLARRFILRRCVGLSCSPRSRWFSSCRSASKR